MLINAAWEAERKKPGRENHAEISTHPSSNKCCLLLGEVKFQNVGWKTRLLLKKWINQIASWYCTRLGMPRVAEIHKLQANECGLFIVFWFWNRRRLLSMTSLDSFNIHFANSGCTIFSLWKQGPPHQTFPS